MADTITLEVFAAELERIGQPGAVEAAIAAALKVCEPIAAAGYRRCFVEQKGPDGTPWPPLAHGRAGRESGGEKALWDTGRLIASGVAKADGNTLELGTNLVGAALHNFGGLVAPRNVTYLAIPATAAARRAGSPRRFPQPLSPRINRKRGKGVLVDESGEVQYYLTKGPVVIPARPFVGFSAETLGEIAEVLVDHITKVLV